MHDLIVAVAALSVTSDRCIVALRQSVTVRRQAAATISAFLEGLNNQGMIGSADGTQPYSVQIDNANNPQNRVALGYMQADVKVRYLSVIEKFIINVEGGQSVTISRQSVALA